MAQRWAGSAGAAGSMRLPTAGLQGQGKAAHSSQRLAAAASSKRSNRMKMKSSRGVWLLLDYMDSVENQKKKPKYLWLFLTEQVWCIFTSEFQKALCQCSGKSRQGLPVPADTGLRTHHWQSLIAKEEAMQITVIDFYRSAKLRRQHISTSYSRIPVWLFGQQG